MTIVTPTPRRFGEEFVAAQRRKYDGRPRTYQPRTHDIAVKPKYALWRDWFDEQLALLPTADADGLARKLWKEDTFWPVINELATGAWLRAAGFRIGYELPWGDDRLTPDWTVLDEAGRPLCFVEVCTDQMPQEKSAIMKDWFELARRIAKIPVSVVLTLDGQGVQPERPTPQLSKRIAARLKDQLLSGSRNLYEVYGYRVIVMADPWTRRAMTSPNGLRAVFEPPSPLTGPVTAGGVVERVEEKVRRYRDLADAYNVPLVVAAGADKDTNVQLDNLDDLLEGRPTVTFQVGYGDSFIGTQTMVAGQPQRWTMPPELAGVLWVSNDFPFRLTARPNASAVRAMPSGCGAQGTATSSDLQVDVEW